MAQNGVGTSPEHIEGNRIRCKFMSIDETTAGFVECVAWQPVVNVELPSGLYGLGTGTHQAVNFFLRRLRSRHSIGSRQSRKVLTKRMSGNEPVKVILLVKVVRIVIPATEVGAGSRHPLTLAKRFEQPILVEMKEQFMVLVELQTEGPVQELHVRVSEDRKWRNDGPFGWRLRPCGNGTHRQHARGRDRR